MNLTNIDKLNMLIEQGMFEPVELDEKNIVDGGEKDGARN